MKVIYFVTLFISSSVAMHEYFDSLSFGVDETDCGIHNGDEWDLVDYKSVGVEPRLTDLALKANTDSCLSIVNHAVVNGSVEIDLCTYLVSQNSGVEVIVYDNSDIIFLRRKFTVLSEEYKNGWNTVEIPLNGHKGYINIIGHSTGTEIILIDAIRFVLQTSRETQVINIKLHDGIKQEGLITTKKEKEYDLVDDMLLMYNEVDDDKFDDIEGNGDNMEGSDDSIEGSGDNIEGSGDSIEGSGDSIEENSSSETTEGQEETTEESTEDESQNEEATFWNALTISLTVIGSVAGVSALLYGAYYFGKTRGPTDLLVEEFDDMESSVTIPRVRPTFRYDY